MPLDLSPAIIVVCAAICFFAATVVGFSGFGFALMTVPLLTLLLDLKTVVPLELLLVTFCLIILSANKLRFAKEPAVIYIFVGMVAGLLVGVHLLANFETGLLKKALGAFVILFAFHIFSRGDRERAPKPGEGVGQIAGVVVALVVGVLSGIAGGLFGTSGPPLVVYVDHFAKDKTEFRAQLIILFLLNDIIRIFLYYRYSLLTMEIGKFALWLLPAVCLGLFLGSKMHFRVTEKTFGRAIAAMLFVSGLLLILRP
jgi:uncharacterized membrane protein YfcA